MESAQSDQEKEIPITIVDILDYVGESVRPIKEGYAVFAANHIICIGWRSTDRHFLCVEAYVNQSSNPGNTPHKIDLKIGGSVSDWILVCSCKAGTNKCKHIIACLLHMERYRKLEYLSCTDVTQAWGISKSQRSNTWGAKRVMELCCVKKSKEVQAGNGDTEEILSDSFKRILNVSSGSAIAKHLNGRFMNPLKAYPNRALQLPDECETDIYCSAEELSECLTKNSCQIGTECVQFDSDAEASYYKKHVEVDLNKSVAIALATKEQCTNEWKIERSVRVTASSCYQLITYMNNKSPDWNKKIEQYWCVRSLNLKATKYGKDTEPLAFNCYKRKRNPLIKKCGLVIHPEESWIGGSPDGLDALGGIILEIKCPGSGEMSLEDIIKTPNVQKYIQQKNDIENRYTLRHHHTYYCQVQLNMWILNCQTADFIIYSRKDDDFLVLEVPFDRTFVETSINNLKKLYYGKMIKKLVT